MKPLTQVRGYIASENSRTTPQMERGSGIFAAMYPRIWVLIGFFVLLVFQSLAANESESKKYSDELVFEPNFCFETTSLCAIKSRMDQKGFFKTNSAEVFLNPDTILLKKEEGITLVQGAIIVEAKSNTKIITEFGSIELNPGTKGILVREESQVRVFSLKNSLFINPLGLKESLSVSAGYENWLSRVDKSGHAQSGIPRSANLKKVISIWSMGFIGKKLDFLNELNNFQSKWKLAIHKSSGEHRSLASARIQWAEQERERKRLEREAETAEEARIRGLFWKKVFEE